mgnify:CR=1 FL=1
MSLIAAGNLKHARPLLPALSVVYELLGAAINVAGDDAQVSFAGGSFDADLAEHCCGFVGNLAAEVSLRPALVADNRWAAAVTTTIRCALDRGAVALVSTAAWCLSNMARGAETSARVFAEADSLTAVIPLLKPLDPATIAAAVARRSRPRTLSGGVPTAAQLLLLQTEALWVAVFLSAKEPNFVTNFVARNGLLQAVLGLFTAPSTADAKVLLLCLRTMGNLITVPGADGRRMFTFVARNEHVWRRLHQLLSRQLALAGQLSGAPPQQTRVVGDLFEELAVFLQCIIVGGNGEAIYQQVFIKTGSLAIMCKLFGDGLCFNNVERELGFALASFARAPQDAYVHNVINGCNATSNVLPKFIDRMLARSADAATIGASLRFIACALERLPYAVERVNECDGIFALEEILHREGLPEELRQLATQLLDTFFDGDNFSESDSDDGPQGPTDFDIIAAGGQPAAQGVQAPRGSVAAGRGRGVGRGVGRGRNAILPPWA